MLMNRIVVVVGLSLACGAGNSKPELSPSVGSNVSCLDGDRNLFSCAAEGDTVIAVCSAIDLSWIQYRFGKEGAPELIFPKDVTGSSSSFQYRKDNGAQYEADVLTFSTLGQRYEVTSSSGSGKDEEEAAWNKKAAIRYGGPKPSCIRYDR